MSTCSIGSSNGSFSFYEDEVLQNLRDQDVIDQGSHQQMEEHHPAHTNELLDDLNEISFSSDEENSIEDHGNDDYGACNGDDIESTEQHNANSDGVLINNHDVQNTQNHLPISELISRTQMSIRSQHIHSASGENLPNFPTLFDVGHQVHESTYLNSNASEHRNLDHLGNDYHDDYTSRVELYGNVFPVKGQWDSGQGQSNGNSNTETDEINIVRPSIEDFDKLRESYALHQGHGHYYGHHGQIDNSGNNHQDPQLCDVAEQPYDQTIHENLCYHDQVQLQVYDTHYVESRDPDGHHYFENIYERPYHTIQERVEAEGGNIIPLNDHPFYLHHGYIADAPGYNVEGTEMPEMEVDNTKKYSNQAFFSHSQPGTKSATKTALASGGVGRKLPQVTYRPQNSETHQTESSQSKITPETTTTSIEDSYKYSSGSKVKYDKDSLAKKKEAKIDEKKENWSEKSLEKEFMDLGGQRDSQQFAQLQILYKARGRQIEDLINQMDLLKNDSTKDIRILKHRLTLAEGEKEGAAKSLENVQSLLQESKSENARLLGRVHACESQAEGLKKVKEELLQKLQTAESTIEAQQQHLNELGSSDSLTRARQDHETVVSGLQKRYDAEIKLLKETIDCLNATTHEKDEDITVLKQKLNESIKNLASAEIYHAGVRNDLIKSLDNSQKQNTQLLEANTTQQVSHMKMQLQQALAAKSISDEMCSTLQEENQDLKEQVQMLEGASNVGVFLAPGHSSGGGAFTDQNDSMSDLGIKKTLDFADTPHSTPNVKITQNTMKSVDMVLSLKSELERCLVSNMQKRHDTTELKEQLQKVRKEMMDYKQRCENAELLVQEQKKKIAEFESCFSPSNQTSVIENRYKKEIENLKREKQVLIEDVEDLQKRLVEFSNSEANLTELNRDLRKQISDMVKEYDQDKRETVESVQRACEQVWEVTRKNLHKEMISHFDAERTEIIAKCDKKCDDLRDELAFSQNELDSVKNEYMKVCNEMVQTEKNVTAAMKKENESSLLRAEEEWSKQKELDIENVKQDLLQQFNEEKSKIEEAIKKDSAAQLNIALNNMKIKHESKLNIAQGKFENELKSLKHMLEMEKSNDLDTLDKIKLNEIETLKRIIVDKESAFNEREQTFREKEKMFSARNKLIEDQDRLLKEKDMCLEAVKNKHEVVIGNFEIELSKKASQIEHLSKQLEESGSLNNYLKTSLEHVKIDAKEKIERDLVQGKVVKDMTAEINKLKEELEKIQKEKEAEIGKWRKEDVDNLRKDVDNDIQKDRLVEIESLKKEVINLRLKMERMDSEKLSEINKVFRIKQAEIDNLEKRHITEIERLQKEKYIEIEKVTKTKNEEINKLQKMKEVKILDEDDVTSEIREMLNKKFEAEFNTVEKKVAMSKVACLEEQRATRKAANDSAIRLAEAELRQKMENELDARLQQRLKEVLILELESERQKWAKEFEQRQEEEKESWKEVELETEKLKWTSQWEHMLQEEKDSWVKNMLEPTLKKFKLEAEETLKIEKENWRCMELETEKLNLLKDFEERLSQERQKWNDQVLIMTLEKEKEVWNENMEERLKMEKTYWVTVELAKEIDNARVKWLDEVQIRLKEERKNWENCDLPGEIEKERRKWMKLMEQTLIKEKENWKNKDIPAEVEKVKQAMEEQMEKELEQRWSNKLEVEKEKLQKESEAKVLEAIEEHQEICEQELHLTIAKEKELLKQKFDIELQERFQTEKKVWKEIVEHEVRQKLEIEKEKWQRTADIDLNNKLEFEKEILTSRIRADMQKKLEQDRKYMKEEMEKKFNEQLNSEIQKISEKFDIEVRENFEHLKAKFDDEKKQEYVRMKMQLEQESQMNLDREREALLSKSDIEFSRKLADEQKNWRHQFERELSMKLQNEEQKWKKMIENDIENRIKQEKEKWEQSKKTEWTISSEQEKEHWLKQWCEKKENEIKEKLEKKFKEDLIEEMEKCKAEEEHRFHMSVEHEVNLAVEEARDDWNREYMMEMSISTTSAETSQSLLKEEIQRLKDQLEFVHLEMMEKEKAWLKEKEDIIAQKDQEHRRSLDSLQDQTESEYTQFIHEHKDTLDKALKAAREQQNKDKAELEERYNTQIKLLQARDKSLQQQLQEFMQVKQHQSDIVNAVEKERVTWYEEREHLLQDIADRDSLLGKADVHLSKEVDKLRSELQAAYQRRLETEMSTWRQKIEAEFARANNSEQKEKLQLEKQLSEVKTELNKLKCHWNEEKGKYLEETKTLTNKVNDMEKKVDEYSRLEGEYKMVKELLKGYKEDLLNQQTKCETYKVNNQELSEKLEKAMQSQEKLQGELKLLKEEKSISIDTVQSIEASYRKDIGLYKEKLEEASKRLVNTEKYQMYLKKKYQSKCDEQREQLEGGYDVAMNVMKTKMIELHKQHAANIKELQHKHDLEKEELLKHGKLSITVGTTPTPNVQCGVEEIDKTVKELRSQYLDTVAKIKGDVLRHVTETSVRAAETVKIEVDKERMSTYKEIKEFYKSNVTDILESEIVSSAIQNKLLAVEEALETFSSNVSSRSTTPRSVEFNVDERQIKSRSRSASRDAGISPKGQRSVSFITGTKGERSKTPLYSDKEVFVSAYHVSQESKNPFTKSPCDADVKIRGERNEDIPGLNSSLNRNYDHIKDSGFDTRFVDSRPLSTRTAREMLQDEDLEHTKRQLSAKNLKDVNASLRYHIAEEVFDNELSRERDQNGDKKKSRTLISARDIHAGHYSRQEGYEMRKDFMNGSVHSEQRAKSVTPKHINNVQQSSSLFRPTSVPDLSSEDKELKLWAKTNNDTYRYTPLKDTLKRETNLHRVNSKSESDLSITDKYFCSLKAEYDSNLDLSLENSDTFMSPRKSRDAGETPTSTPRRHYSRTNYTFQNIPTHDQTSDEQKIHKQFNGNNTSQVMKNSNGAELNSPISSTRYARKNLPLIQFRTDKMQSLARIPAASTKSPHPDEEETITNSPISLDRHYRPLSVSTNMPMKF